MIPRPSLLRLPGTVPVAAAREAALALPASAWLAVADDGGFLGDRAVPLITPGGAASFDFSLAGAAAVTAVLAGSPPLFDLLSRLPGPIARARLLRSQVAQSRVGACLDYQRYRYRSFLVGLAPLSGLRLHCGSDSLPFAAGDVIEIDRRQAHGLSDPTGEGGLTLLVETLAAADLSRAPEPAAHLRLAADAPILLTPAEVSTLCAEIAEATAALPPDEASTVRDELAALQAAWAATFARYGHHRAGELSYLDILLRFRGSLLPLLTRRGLAASAATILDTALSVAPAAPRRLHRPPPALPTPDAQVVERALVGDGDRPPLFARPLFVMSAPRAGSTLLFDLLARLPDVVTLGGESHEVIRGIPALHPAARGYASDALSAAEATPEVCAALCRALAVRLRRRDGTSLLGSPAPSVPGPLRFVEKTPANALRIPFLRSVFPDAQFIYLKRDPRENLSSLLEGWRERRFLAYSDLPGWPHRGWSFLLPPGWPALVGRPLVEIVAAQYSAANLAIERDLADLPPSRVATVDFEELLAAPRAVLRRLADFAALAWDEEADRAIGGDLPLSRVTLSAPRPGKWRRHADELATVLPDPAEPSSPSPSLSHSSTDAPIPPPPPGAEP